MNQLNGSGLACLFRAHKTHIITFLAFFVLTLLPISSAMATSGIASNVAAFCAPQPTMPDVGSCSACHSSTNNRGPNDLTAAGMWSLSQATFVNFCPTATTPPPAPTPAPSPPTSPPPGMSPSPGTGMGMSGGAMDEDEDDDDMDMDDDDDDDGIGAAIQRILGRDD